MSLIFCATVKAMETIPDTVTDTLIEVENKSIDENNVKYLLQINIETEDDVIAAVYRGEILCSLNMEKVKNKSAEVSVEGTDEGADVEFMLWDSLANMQPLCSVLVIKESMSTESPLPTPTPMV